MTAKPKRQFDKTKGILIIATGLVSLFLIILLSVYLGSNRQISNLETGAHVSLGGMDYDFSNGKAIKRTDKNITELKSFLTAAAEKDVSKNCPVSYYNVITSSKNEDQVLLGYGCYHPTARMFAVKQKGSWEFITPTNQFDLLGIPLCSHVTKHNIEASIAPVCASEDGLKYEVRSR